MKNELRRWAAALAASVLVMGLGNTVAARDPGGGVARRSVRI